MSPDPLWQYRNIEIIWTNANLLNLHWYLAESVLSQWWGEANYFLTRNLFSLLRTWNLFWMMKHNQKNYFLSAYELLNILKNIFKNKRWTQDCQLQELVYWPPSEKTTYWELVHENLDPCNQSLHLDLECSSQLGKLDLHPILQKETEKSGTRDTPWFKCQC